MENTSLTSRYLNRKKKYYGDCADAEHNEAIISFINNMGERVPGVDLTCRYLNRKKKYYGTKADALIITLACRYLNNTNSQ